MFYHEFVFLWRMTLTEDILQATFYVLYFNIIYIIIIDNVMPDN